ncbi:hypothetical protein ECANGB1_2312 [Enterospora canceri]|uniref:Uncharacterized protein n=1 Tax=Enterospora canceri TaxID=1081671 RepID=A0A1Y1S4T6_9MICR|nr:hypothetical protein ECANGB1_2312 [Enterospora canceri]
MLLTIAIMTMYLAAIFPIALCYILLLLGLRKLKNWIMLNYNRTIWLLQNMLFKQLVVLEIDLCDYSKAKDVLVISNHQAVLDCLGLNYILHCNTIPGQNTSTRTHSNSYQYSTRYAHYQTS